jgi:hypothetical protein
MIRGLLVTDPAASPPRPTDDVDLIIDVPSRLEYYRLGEELRQLGFREDMEEGAPICRWLVDGVRADIMPIDPGILGFSNVWYPAARDYATVTTTAEGDLRHLDGPHFCATKLEAFATRGEGDFYHRDLEDVIALVDERGSLVEEIANAPEELRDFIAEAIAGLLASEPFLEALPGHLQADSASQARLPLLRSRLDQIAALRAPAQTTPPPSVFPSLPSAPVFSRPKRGALVPDRSLMPRSPAAPGSVLLRSSNLHSVEYDPATSSLTIEFRRGGLYRYSGVPSGIYEGLLGTYSAGRYFHQWIRNRYSSTRLR